MRHFLYILLVLGLFSCESETDQTHHQRLESLYEKDTLSFDDFRIISNDMVGITNLDSVKVISDTSMKRLVKVMNTYVYELCPHEDSILSKYSEIKDFGYDSLFRKTILKRYEKATFNAWRNYIYINELEICLGTDTGERYHINSIDTCQKHSTYLGRSSGEEF